MTAAPATPTAAPRTVTPTSITGLGVICSIGQDATSFTAALREGRCGIVLAADPADPDGATHLAPLGDFDLVDTLDTRAGLPAELRRDALRAARRSPLPVQAALAAALEAWQRADLIDRPVASERIGLIVGGHNLTGRYAFDQYATFQREPAYLPRRYALHIQDTDHVGTISQALGIRGEGYTVGASSASGNAALIHAARLVACGAVDVCLAVGASARLAPPELAALANLGLLAAPGPGIPADRACRPFDRARSGIVPGEAAACVVLESEESAARRAVPVLARLAGYAAALDGNSLSNPDPLGEARAMRAALLSAGTAAAAVDYVNAHGTGTPAGDDAELKALRELFNAGDPAPWLNSTKALTGHCLSAAGVLEAVATVAQIRAGFVHPNPALTEAAEPGHRLVGRTASPARIERALSNSFGFGGFNSSVLICGPEVPVSAR